MAVLVFFATFAVYLYSLAPSITVGDSGEFCAAASILGLAHSPGYPLFGLIGKASSILFPFANIAYRINLLCAFCGALTASLLFVCLKNLIKTKEKEVLAPAEGGFYAGLAGDFVCLCAVMLFAFSPAFWQASIQAEVFTLNTLFAVIIIYSIIKGRQYLAMLAFGLGLGNHHTLVFMAPLILSDLYAGRPYPVKKLVTLALLFSIGFGVYAYLPIRSAKEPALNWGSPVTVEKFVRVITRADYGSLSLTIGQKLERNASNTLKQVKRFITAVNHQYTIIGFLLGLAGIYYGIKNRYSNFKNIAFVWALAGPGFILLANMPFNPETEGILERFYILVNLFWAFFAAAGAQAFFSGFRNRHLRVLALVVAVAALTVPRLSALSWRSYFLEYDYGRNIFRTLAPNAIFFMDGGDDTFYSTAYLQFAEGLRKDVELHDRGGLVFKNIYGRDFRRITKEEKELRRRTVEKAYIGIRPVYYSTFNRDIMPGVRFEPDGVLYRPAAERTRQSFFAYSDRGIYGSNYMDYRSRALAPIYPYFETFYDPARREQLRGYALGMWPDAMWLKGNVRIEMLGEAYEKYTRREYVQAAALYERILKLFPGDYETLVNLGVAWEKMKDYEKAVVCYKTAAALEPGKTDAYYNIAVIYWQKGDWDKVVEYLGKMLEINPNEPRARQYMPIALGKISKSKISNPKNNQ